MAREQRGPFERILKTTTGDEPARLDRATIYVIGSIIGFGLLLLILVLPPISILSGGGGGAKIPSRPGDADHYTSTVRTGIPRLPAGLTSISGLFDLAAPADQRGASRITVPLKDKQTEQQNLALYSYVDGTWQRLAGVTLTAGGLAARGEVGSLPGNVVVLKRSKATLQVAGSMPAGTDLDPNAQSVITTLHPIVFIPADDGSLVGLPPAVPPASYKVVPVIVAPVPDVVDTMLRSTDTSKAHASAIADAVKNGNFAGIDVDYRNVNPTLKDRFSAFVSQLADDLHADGRSLTLTLPLPSTTDGAIDTGAYDWEKLGQLADTIELTGELDQELYFQHTTAALDFVVTQVDRSKVLLSINSLSVERGGDGLRTMSQNDAMTIASQVAVKTTGDIFPDANVQLVATNLAAGESASGIHWDDEARSVTFSYQGRGGKRTVWVSNAFSAAFRLALAQQYNLGGVTIADVSTQDGGADVWAPVQQLSDVGTLTLSRPNGEMLSPTWSTGDGSLSPQVGDTTVWKAPTAPGTYQVVLIVGDGVVRVGQQVSIDVVTAPQ